MVIILFFIFSLRSRFILSEFKFLTLSMSKIELKNSVNDLEQRVFIKLGVLLNRTAKEIAKDLKKL